MTITNFKSLVAEYINRDEATLTTPQDKLLLAANHAKKMAQLLYRFERCRTSAKLTVDKDNGGQLTSATKLDGNAITIRNLERAFVKDSNTGLYFPVDLISRDEQINRLQRIVDRVPTNTSKANNEIDILSGISWFSVVQHGLTIYAWPWNSTTLGATTTEVRFDVVEFLPDYDGVVLTDFFITECVPWMLLATIRELNSFLKDDERVPLDTKLLEERWEAVKNWDASLVSGSFPITLD